MMKLKENITEFPEDVDLHNLGPLVKEFESIDMKVAGLCWWLCALWVYIC